MAAFLALLAAALFAAQARGLPLAQLRRERQAPPAAVAGVLLRNATNSTKPLMDTVGVYHIMMCWGRQKLLDDDLCMNFMVKRCTVAITAQGYCTKLRDLLAKDCDSGKAASCTRAVQLGVSAAAKVQKAAQEKAEKSEEKAEAKAEMKVENKAESKAEEKAEKKAEVKDEGKSEKEAKMKVEEKAETKAEVKVEEKAEKKAEVKTEEKAEKKAEVKTEKKAEKKAEVKVEKKAEKNAEMNTGLKAGAAAAREFFASPAPGPVAIPAASPASSPFPSPAMAPMTAPSPAPAAATTTRRHTGISKDIRFLPPHGFDEYNDGGAPIMPVDLSNSVVSDWGKEWPLHRETEKETTRRICEEQPEHAWCKLWLSRQEFKAQMLRKHQQKETGVFGGR